MTAPTPKAVSWNGPRVRRKLCSPVCFASASNALIVFLANNPPMRGLLESPNLSTRSPIRCPGLQPVVLLNLSNPSPFPHPRPNHIYRHPEQHDHQTRPSGLRPVQQQHKHDG